MDPSKCICLALSKPICVFHILLYHQTANVRALTYFQKKQNKNLIERIKTNEIEIPSMCKCSCELGLRPTSAPVLPLYQANSKMFVSESRLWFPSGLDAAAVGMNGIFRLVVGWAHYHNGAATLLVRWHKTVKRWIRENGVELQWTNAELLFACVRVVISSIWLG